MHVFGQKIENVPYVEALGFVIRELRDLAIPLPSRT